MPYKIVFFDIDGTLVNEDKVIPRDTKEAIQELRKRNIEVVIATGRAPFHLRHIADELEINSFVSFNGSYVVYKGQPIYEHSISKTTLAALEGYSKQYGHPLVYLGHEECYVNQEEHPHVNETFEYLRVNKPKYHPNCYEKLNIYQVLLYCQAQEESHYNDKFADVSFIRWHTLSMDVLPAGGSKAIGIQSMLKHLNIPPADAVAFGDGLNDKEMLSFVGMGIAMGNAHEELKPFAKLTTKHVNEGGIRHGLELIKLL